MKTETSELRSLVYDNVSGAREITQRGLALLQRAATTSTAADPASLVDELADLSLKILRSKPEMATVLHAINRFLLAAEDEEARAADLGPFRIALVGLLNDHVQGLASQLARVAQNAQALVPNGAVILTHSRSSTVLAALKLSKKEGKLFDVIVTESRPNLEGRTLARELAEDQIPVRLIVDSMAATAVEGADRVLVGADAITGHGVVNKVGTRAVALAARDADVPVTVAAESSKAWVKKTDPKLGMLTGRTREPREVWDTAPYGVEVVNLYFEITPFPLVSEIVDEEGAHGPTEWWTRVQSRGFARRLKEALGDEIG